MSNLAALFKQIHDSARHGLSPRETETLVLYSEGKNRDQVAATMGVAPSAVTSYFKKAQNKLGGKTPQHTMVLFERKERELVSQR